MGALSVGVLYNTQLDSSEEDLSLHISQTVSFKINENKKSDRDTPVNQNEALIPYELYLLASLDIPELSCSIKVYNV